MITLTVQAASVSELHANLRAILNQQSQLVAVGPMTSDQAQEVAAKISKQPGVTHLGNVDIPQQPPQTNEFVAAGAEQFPEEKQEQPAAGKRKRRTKAEIEAEKNASRSPEETFETKQHDTRAEEAPAAVSTSKVTGTVNKENVHQALQQVNVAVGLPKAREILASFKVNRISEIKEDQYKAFVDKCNEAVMLEG